MGKLMDNMTIINTSLNGDDFMQCGLLLNTSGKERMAETVGKRINQLMSKKKELLILLKWEEYQNEHSHEEIKEHPNCGDIDKK